MGRLWQSVVETKGQWNVETKRQDAESFSFDASQLPASLRGKKDWTVLQKPTRKSPLLGAGLKKWNWRPFSMELSRVWIFSVFIDFVSYTIQRVPHGEMKVVGVCVGTGTMDFSY